MATCRSAMPRPPPAQRNTWLVNNADRVLFGASKSQSIPASMPRPRPTIDNTADKLTAAQFTLAKRIARTATPKIRPIRVNGDEEWYVMLVPSHGVPRSDARSHHHQRLQYAWNRGSDNPLFTAGDILYDGVIIREIPELPTIADVGAGATVDAGARISAAHRPSASPGHNAPRPSPTSATTGFSPASACRKSAAWPSCVSALIRRSTRQNPSTTAWLLSGRRLSPTHKETTNV